MMTFYYIKIALRNILRNKGFTLINLIGLSLGMACSFFMSLVVYDFYKIDTFQKNRKNLFLIQQTLQLESGKYTTDRVGGATGPTLKNAYPTIKDFARIGKVSKSLLTYFGDDHDTTYNHTVSLVEDEGLAVDANFFILFTFKMIKGNPNYAIRDNNFIVLTKSLADKFFGEKDPLGEIIIFNDEKEFMVTGIMEDVPLNSSLQFTYLIPFETMDWLGFDTESYDETNFLTYLLLDDPADASLINAEINEFLESKYDEQLEINRFITNIQKAYIYGESRNYLALYVFLVMGIGILMIACINYINLTTAKSLERTKEIGIRKTGGANKVQLIGQFLGESVILSLLSIHLAILLLELTLPKINQIFESNLLIDLTDPVIWISLFGMVFITGILSGFYPAFYLSSLHPVSIMQKFKTSGKRGNQLRKILVVTQFAITLFFIISTLFLYRQFAYIQTADLGITKENIIYIPTWGELWIKYPEIKQELLKEPGIEYVSTASDLPNMVQSGDIDWGKSQEEHNMIARIMWSGVDLDKTFNLELMAGHFYSEDNPAEWKDGIIVNEEIVKILGYEADPIGKPFRLWDMNKKIIGVVKDYTFQPINVGGKALILPYKQTGKYIFLRVAPGFSMEHIVRVKEIFHQFIPYYPLEYHYLDEFQYPFFEATDDIIQLLFYLCLLGIIISCLGLFGLALYTTQKKTKEIGIRKVFGASVLTIVFMLSKDFLKLVALSCIIAIPLSVLMMKVILQFFTVKINISGLFVTLIVLVMILIAFLTVVWQASSAARKNPIKSLRYE
jgi:ABC-type antimicrobial peptide transport system permease subunit